MNLIYESEEGLKLVLEHNGNGTPPRTVREHGVEYVLAGQAFDRTDLAGALDGLTVAAATRPRFRDGYFESSQLPRWDPHHRAAGGEFSKDGKPRFRSRKEAREYARRASGETGLDVRYGEL